MLAFILSISSINAFAATVTQDNLEVTLVTDKEKYSENEQIKTTLTVKNNNDTAVTNVDLETALPDGYKLADKSENKKTVDSIAAGESVSLDVTLEKDNTKKDSTPSELSTDSKSSTNPVNGGNSGSSGTTTGGNSNNSVTTTGEITTNGSAVQTGQGLLIVGIILLVLLTSGVIFVFVYRKNQSMKNASKRLLSLVICLSISCGSLTLVSIKTKALEENRSVGVSTSIFVDEKSLKIESTVKYFYTTSTDCLLLTDFASDEEYFSCGLESNILFTVKSNCQIDKIKLIEDDNSFVGFMRDDGTNGDEQANDGIYSYQWTDTVVADTLVKRNFYAETNGFKSNTKEVFFFAQLSEENAVLARSDFNDVKDTLQKIENHYLNEDGSVPNEKKQSLITDIDSALDEYKVNGVVLKYAVENYCIYIKLTSGLTLMYEPAEKHTSTNGTDVTVDFVSYQPNPDIENDVVTNLMSECANEYIRNSHDYKGETVNLDLVKNLPSNTLVFWNGHGGYGPFVRAFLCSGESFNWTKWWFDINYFNDCVQDRIICRGTKKQDDLACFTSKFISHYCGDLSNDCFILASCHSLQDTNIADALLCKNAEAVLGFSDTVYTGYCLLIGGKCVSYMTEINSETGNYYTLREALNRSMSEEGSNDIEFAHKHPETFTSFKAEIAEPRIWEGNDADNYRLLNATGQLSGKVCKASDRTTAIPNATVTVYKNGRAYLSQKTDANGNYLINLAEGEYYVDIKASGYIDFHSYATVTNDENTYMETFLMVEGIEGDKGTARGKVINSLTNVGTDGVNLTIRKDWNNTNNDAETIGSTTTSSGGTYSIELPLGNYTVVASKDGYLTSTFNIIVQSGTTGSQNGTITPIVDGDDYLITLTWGENPRDLDSHVEGTLSSGSSFHVYYPSSNMNQYDGDIKVCSLDYDDTTSYGPEHITLKPTTNDPYYYYIHKYAGSGTVASSGAKITVHKGNQLIATYNVPTNLGSDDYWNVFAIKNGQIINKNTITSSADTSYAR